MPFSACDEVVRWREFKWAPLPNELLRAWLDNLWVLPHAGKGDRLEGRPAAEFVSPR